MPKSSKPTRRAAKPDGIEDLLRRDAAADSKLKRLRREVEVLRKEPPPSRIRSLVTELDGPLNYAMHHVAGLIDDCFRINCRENDRVISAATVEAVMGAVREQVTALQDGYEKLHAALFGDDDSGARGTP